MPKKLPKKTKHPLLTKTSKLSRKAKHNFATKHPAALVWLTQNNIDLGSIRTHSKKLITSGAVMGTLLLTASTNVKQIDSHSTVTHRLSNLDLNTSSELQNQLSRLAQNLTLGVTGHLDPEKEKLITSYLSRHYNINAKSTLEGNRLNHSIGRMGFEQHLKRYPGDGIEQHNEIQQSGIAPGLGAWGYFTHSNSTLTQEDIDREKYYFAVQTLYLPDWNTNTRALRTWYKYRKMIAINPLNGHAVVGVIADAGPAKFTGKHFGGSPEVIDRLELRKSKDLKVILLFVDDPENKIPLGPLDLTQHPDIISI